MKKEKIVVYGLTTEGYFLASQMAMKGADVSIIDESSPSAVLLKAETAKTYPDLTAFQEDEPLLSVEPIDVAISNAKYLFFAQRIRSRWVIIDELVAEDMGIVKFADVMKQHMAKYLPRDFYIYGDPAGDHRVQTDESTPFQILRGKGIHARPAPSNDVLIRLESVNTVLSRMVDGESGILLDPKCNN